jgi:hypothetical protein
MELLPSLQSKRDIFLKIVVKQSAVHVMVQQPVSIRQAKQAIRRKGWHSQGPSAVNFGTHFATINCLQPFHPSAHNFVAPGDQVAKTKADS